MEVIGSVSGLLTIIGAVTAVAKRLNEVRDKYNNVALNTTLVASQVGTFQVFHGLKLNHYSSRRLELPFKLSPSGDLPTALPVDRPDSSMTTWLSRSTVALSL